MQFQDSSRSHLALGATVLASMLLYLPSLEHDFVYDDPFLISRNPRVQSLDHLPSYFTTHYFAGVLPDQYANYYRPLCTVWLALNYAAFGNAAWGFHLTAILLNTLVVLLVYLLARSWTESETAALVAAALFAFHPAHVEAAAWVSSFNEPLLAIFFLSALFGYRRSVVTGRVAWTATAAMAYAAALLTKETALVLLPMALVVEFVEWPPGQRAWRFVPGCWVRLASLLLPTALYFLARYHALGGLTHTVVKASWAEAAMTLPAVFVFYIRQLLLPVWLSPFYTLDFIASPWTARFLLPLLNAVGLIAVLLLAARHSKTMPLAAALLVLPLLPPMLSTPVFQDSDLVHDRFLYLGSAGGCILAAVALRRLAAFRPAVYGTAVAVLLGAMALVSFRYQSVWSDDATLFRAGRGSAPDSSAARVNMANQWERESRPQEAMEECRAALRLNPNNWRAHFLLGNLLQAQGRSSEAESHLLRAADLDPRNADQFLLLAMVKLQLGQVDEAERYLVQRAGMAPPANGLEELQGDIHLGRGNLGRARRAYLETLRLDPTNLRIHQKMDALGREDRN